MKGGVFHLQLPEAWSHRFNEDDDESDDDTDDYDYDNDYDDDGWLDPMMALMIAQQMIIFAIL